MGLYDHLLTDDGRRTFEETVWTLTPTADRVGFRYKGEKLELLEREQPFGAGSDPSNIVDAPYPIGSIQVPGGVEPIVLHRDAVSGGGYAMIATVISADMDAVAQSAPGAKTRSCRSTWRARSPPAPSATAGSRSSGRHCPDRARSGRGAPRRGAARAPSRGSRSPRCSSRPRRRPPARNSARSRRAAPGRCSPATASCGAPARTPCTSSPRPSRAASAVPLGDAPAGSELAAAANGVAARGRGRAAVRREPGRAVSRLRRPGDRRAADRHLDPGVQVTSAGVLTLEDGAVQLRGPDGRIREVAVPPGADPTRVAAAGDLAVAPTPEGALTVFDVRNDIERGQISLGRFDPNTITGLAISPEGDVAADRPGRRRRRRARCGRPRARPASASSCAGTSTRAWPSGAGASRSSPPTACARACARS